MTSQPWAVDSSQVYFPVNFFYICTDKFYIVEAGLFFTDSLLGKYYWTLYSFL